MIWLVQKEKFYAQKDEHFVIWLVQKQNFYGQKAEPVYDLAGTERRIVRTERRTFL